MYIGDLHIHSRYSRATSRDCTPEYLDLWARKKGIDIVGTGDFTHPAWREELKEKLEPAEDGLYVLKKEYRIGGAGESGRQPRFVVTGEISSIYKKRDRVRKVHSLFLLPGLEAAETFARRLELIGNIHSDGRPILGIPCRDLLEIMLETVPEGVYVPAHIWTPHFSLFGAFSGFDTIEECFEDLTPYIHALETGLSSDPPMIWRVGALDRFHLISNSDAHSPAKLGREANLFDIELSYRGLADAVQEGKGLAGTIEFFPEEGKYHFDGHRKCGLCISPQETARYGGRCPVCGKKITIGVLNRIEQLADADRAEGFRLPSGRPFESLVPLPEVIGASMGISPAGKKTEEKYEQMLGALGPEFAILREVPVEDIRRAAGPLVAEGIRRLRDGQVERTPGYDGEYGKIGLLTPEDISSLEGQMSFFTAEELGMMEKGLGKKQVLETFCQKTDTEEDGEIAEKDGELVVRKTEAGKNEVTAVWKTETEVDTEIAGQKTETGKDAKTVTQKTGAGDNTATDRLNERQREAVERVGRSVAVIAGPGAGKTRTLIARLRYLLDTRGIAPEEITAVTFTNKAAEEMRARMAEESQKEAGAKEAGAKEADAKETGAKEAGAKEVGVKEVGSKEVGLKEAGQNEAKSQKSHKGQKDQSGSEVWIGTFHAVCARFLQEAGRSFVVADEGLQMELAEKALREFEKKDSPGKFLKELSRMKNGLQESGNLSEPFSSGAAAGKRGAGLGEAPDCWKAVDEEETKSFSSEIISGDETTIADNAAIVNEAADETVVRNETAKGDKATFADKTAKGHHTTVVDEITNRDESINANNAIILDKTAALEETVNPERKADSAAADGKNWRVYQYYQKLLRQAKAYDYDDLLLETLKLLEEMPEDAPQRRRFSYLLIDEFQDINPLQYRLVKEWERGIMEEGHSKEEGHSMEEGHSRELFVIGDPDQSIYGFRGSDSKAFSRLGEEYPDLSLIRLEENYRSAPVILHAALRMISYNEGEPRRMKAMAQNAEQGTGLPVRIVSAEDERREAIFVAKEITRQIGGIDMLDTDRDGTQEGRRVRGFSDIAVLYRTHRQAALLEKCLRQEGIPYLVAGREDFLREREVRAALYFFHHILYPEETAWKVLCQRLLGPLLGENREEGLDLLAEKYRKKVKKGKPVNLLEEWCGEFPIENQDAMKKLTDMSVLYPTMESFLQTLSFGEDGDIRRNSGRKFTTDAVTLMTLHGSKGLEFPVVFLYGLDRGRLPLEFGGGEADLEEERRLCYVGMTRAREELILVCGEDPSPFLKEIPAGDAKWERAEKEDKEAVQAVQMSLFDLI